MTGGLQVLGTNLRFYIFVFLVFKLSSFYLFACLQLWEVGRTAGKCDNALDWQQVGWWGEDVDDDTQKSLEIYSLIMYRVS